MEAPKSNELQRHTQSHTSTHLNPLSNIQTQLHTHYQQHSNIKTHTHTHTVIFTLRYTRTIIRDTMNSATCCVQEKLIFIWRDKEEKERPEIRDVCPFCDM